MKSENSTPARETSIMEAGLRRKLEFTDPQSTTFGLSELATNIAMPFETTPECEKTHSQQRKADKN